MKDGKTATPTPPPGGAPAKAGKSAVPRPPGDANAKDRDRADPSGPLHGQDPEEVARRMGTGGKRMADPTG